MEQFSTIIIDDELSQREFLAELLQSNFPKYNIKSMCSSVEESFQKIKLLQPKLIFLDVIIPPKTGFDLLSQIGTIDFDIIFTTSYEEYALKAFKVSAVDYLLKPFGINDLRSALNKFEEKFITKQSLRHIEILLQNINNNTLEKTKIALPTQTGFVFVSVSEIIRCESDNTYTTFFLINSKIIVVSKTLKEYEELLSDFGFFRVHNSHLINLSFIKEYMKGEGGIVKMTDGAEVIVSRRKKDEFLRALHKS